MRLRNIPGSKEAIDVSEFVVHDAAAQKGRWQELFPGTGPLYVEIGMGKGRFLMDMAAAHPDCNFVGIEMYSSVLIRAIEKAERRALGEDAPTRAQIIYAAKNQEAQAESPSGIFNPESPVSTPVNEDGLDARRSAFIHSCNFRFLRLDARELETAFAPGEIDRIYLNFSDPWPKDRHAHRRLTSRQFLKRYETVLCQDGTLEFKTDNVDLFQFSLEEIRETGWTLLASTWNLHGDPALNQGNIMTEYEEKFSSRGNQICKLIARKPIV